MSLRLHCTSIGKAILATMPDEEVLALLRRTGMAARTPHTLTDEDLLLKDLAGVRRRGYAEDHEENEAGVCAVGAAVFDHTGQVIGAVSAAALVYLADEESWAADRGHLVRQAAAAVSRALGAGGSPPLRN
jgi:IclR family transcriptional regulator, acetate operon repressor